MLEHGRPRRRERRLAREPEDLATSGELDHLRNPVPGCEGRIEPLRDEHARTPATGRLLADAFDRLLHLLHDRGALLGRAEPACDLEDARLDPGDPAWVERDDLGVDAAQAADLCARDGAHGAEILGEDHIRCERLDQFLVEGIERAPVGQRLADGAVDVEAPDRGRVDPRSRDDGKSLHLGREVALIRAADERVREANRPHDLGRAGQKGADPHRADSRRARRRCTGRRRARVPPRSRCASRTGGGSGGSPRRTRRPRRCCGCRRGARPRRSPSRAP